jgi:hypothetical protein
MSEGSTGTPTQAKAPPRQTKAKSAEVESEAQGMEFEELEPTAPEPSLDPRGADISPVEVFDPDVDPLDVALDYDREEPFEAELVTSVQSAGGPGGVVVAINGNAYALTAQQAGVLVRQLQRAGSAAY